MRVMRPYQISFFWQQQNFRARICRAPLSSANRNSRRLFEPQFVWRPLVASPAWYGLWWYQHQLVAKIAAYRVMQICKKYHHNIHSTICYLACFDDKQYKINKDHFTSIDCKWLEIKAEIDGLMQDCSNSGTLAMELLQSCTKPLKWKTYQMPSETDVGEEISSTK